jgi:Uri superfamily endonuclease
MVMKKIKNKVLKGTYCLIIFNTKEKEILIGKLGKIRFQKGSYVYIGSAMNYLIPRLKRHLTKDKKIHWHIDYLLKSKDIAIEEIIFNIGEERVECDLAKRIAKYGKELANFGSSDCNCNSHLIYFEKYNDCFSAVKSSYDDLSIEYKNLDYLRENKIV